MDVASEKLSQCRSAASYILYEEQQMMIAVITKRFLVLYNCMGQQFSIVTSVKIFLLMFLGSATHFQLH